MMTESLLEVRALRVVFDGFKAVDGFDLSLGESELRFLIGPNGAGKTTLVDAITGLTRPVEGSIRFGGRELIGKSEHEIVRLGVGRTFQAASVFEGLTVLENVDLAASFRRPLLSLFGQRRGIDARVAEALDLTGLGLVRDRQAGVLTHGQKQWLEIAMLLVQEHRVLLLDEPVAGMTGEERTVTGRLLEDIANSRSVLVIEHDMEFMTRFARAVTVMHEGRLLCQGPPGVVQADPRVQEVYLGARRDRTAQQREVG